MSAADEELSGAVAAMLAEYGIGPDCSRVTTKVVALSAEAVIDAIEETFLPHLPSKAISYVAQEDVNAGLDALRERFGLETER